MAKRNYRKSSKKIQPAVETLTFYLGSTNKATESPGLVPGQSTYYCDLSQVASLANRRFYRQGLNWAVGGFRVNSTSVVDQTTQPVASSPNGGVTIQKLPQTWIMSNSWEKAFRTWQKMNNQALEETPSVKPKFLDFKIFMDSGHHNGGPDRNILPVTVGVNGGITNGFTDAIPGEWTYSKVVVPETSTSSGAATEYELIAVGPNNPGAGATGLNAKSLIEGYAASRGLPDILDPNTPDDAATYTQNWMTAIFNEGTLQDSIVIGEMIDENNEAPYPFENDQAGNLDTMYPGGENQLTGLQMHSIENITGSTVGGVTYLRGGTFPCGLIRIDVFNNDQTYQMLNMLQIDLVPGTHRGYLAESMTEM
jgi:hypothetical protein